MLHEAGAKPCCKISRRSLMARILRVASFEGRDTRRRGALDTGALRRLLEQSLPDDRQRTEAVGYVNECPRIVREELGQAALGASDDALKLRALSTALEALSPAALQAMFDYFVPDAHPIYGTKAERVARMGRRLATEALHGLPEAVAEKLLRLDRVETLGEMCHWLAVRLSKMPWVGFVRARPASELRPMLLEAGAQVSNRTCRRHLMARILREAREGRHADLRKRGAPDAGTLRRLLEQAVADGRQRAPASAAVGYIDECPKKVREELAQPVSWHRRRAPEPLSEGAQWNSPPDRSQTERSAAGVHRERRPHGKLSGDSARPTSC